MTTDTNEPGPFSVQPIPAPLTLQQRHEMAAEALRLLKALHNDTTFHGKCLTYADGRMVELAQSAHDAAWLLAYNVELAHKMDIAATLAQVEARA